MPVVAVILIECCGCGRKFRIQETTLEKTIGHLLWTSKDAKEIWLGCPECNHVELSYIEPRKEHVLVEGEEPQLPDNTISFAVFLECARKDCESPIEVLALVSHGTDSHQVKAQAQEWLVGKGVTCPEGGNCKRPLSVLDVRKERI